MTIAAWVGFSLFAIFGMTIAIGIKQALITIAEYCHKQIDCWNCPMLINDGCILRSKTPDYWLRLK